MKRILTLDQGTTSSRALVIDEHGHVHGVSQHEFRQHFPKPGWVEHDPVEIFDTQWRAALEAWEAAGKPQIDGVGITNQRETVVVFDRVTGEPVHPAIVWQDRRTAGILDTMREAEPRVRELTGLPLDPYFSAAKIAWILDHVPSARERAERGELVVGTIDTWLVHRLTGGRVFATEPSNASRTALFDLRAGVFSEELCSIFRVPMACLPEIRDSAGDFGEVTIDGHGWPITGILGDQQAALFGHGGWTAGEAKCTYGTGAFWLTHAGDHAPRSESLATHGLLGTVASRIAGRTQYALEGSVLVAGALVQWLRDGLQIIKSAADLEDLARSVPDSAGVTVVPAFVGLGTPYWDADARGLIAGLTRGVGRGHIARAALEAIALQVEDVRLAVTACLAGGEREGAVTANPSDTVLRVDGGAAQNRLLLEIQATVSGVAVQRSANLEMTAHGASRIALLGIMGWADPTKLPALPSDCGLRIEPGAVDLDLKTLRESWIRAVACSRDRR